MKKGCLKKALTIFGGVVVVVFILVGAFIGYLYAMYPQADPLMTQSIERTPARIARGRYLANHVAQCIACHSLQERSIYSSPPKPGTLGGGGQRVSEPDDVFTLYSANITPAGIGSWTDGEILRAMLCGVDKNGNALGPLMPFEYFRNMSLEDAYSIVAYIRTLQPIQNKVPPLVAPYWGYLLCRYLTRPAAPTLVQLPSPSDKVAYGAYLANMAQCSMCHGPSDPLGHMLTDKLFMGGEAFRARTTEDDYNWVVSANLTRDPTGLGNMDVDQFVGLFKPYRTRVRHVAKGDTQTVMPWVVFSGMTDDDLRCIYAYLRTVKPQSNQVDSFPSPSGTADPVPLHW